MKTNPILAESIRLGQATKNFHHNTFTCFPAYVGFYNATSTQACTPASTEFNISTSTLAYFRTVQHQHKYINLLSFISGGHPSFSTSIFICSPAFERSSFAQVLQLVYFLISIDFNQFSYITMDSFFWHKRIAYSTAEAIVVIIILTLLILLCYHSKHSLRPHLSVQSWYPYSFLYNIIMVLLSYSISHFLDFMARLIIIIHR